MSTTAVIVIVVILIIVVVIGVVLAQRRRSTQLQEHFGPEYERSVTAASGDRRAAEAELLERRHRREEFDVRDLRPEERTRFRDSWNEVQRGFVDDPKQSLHSADLLVAEIMRTRGYPVEDDFDRRADDLSVDHPRVVQHYRDARSVQRGDGEVDTERQRKAITSYRSLVDALLGDDQAETTDGRVGSADRDGHLADRDGRVPADRDGVLNDRDGRVPADRAVPATDPAAASTSTSTSTDDPAGRHALRDTEGLRHADRPADPNGPQSPRTEERTR